MKLQCNDHTVTTHHARENSEQSKLVKEIIDKKETFGQQIQNQEFRLLSDGKIIKSMDFQEQDEELSDDLEDDASDGDDDSGMDSEPEAVGGSGWNPEDDNSDGVEENADSSDEEYQNIDENSQLDDSAQLYQELDSQPDVTIDMSWKEGIADRAREAYLDRQSNNQNLMKLVYGKFNSRNVQQAVGDESEA